MIFSKVSKVLSPQSKCMCQNPFVFRALEKQKSVVDSRFSLFLKNCLEKKLALAYTFQRANRFIANKRKTDFEENFIFISIFFPRFGICSNSRSLLYSAVRIKT